MRLEDLIGKQLGRYTVTRLLGRGGMAAVFAADDSVLRRPVALKILYGQFLSDTQLVERFRREAIIAAKLDHRNIVPIYDVGETNGMVYIAMKLLPGRSLQDVLLERDLLSPEESLDILQQVAAALDYAHTRGVVHRDIKPGNVMLGDDGHVVLSDFGIAKSLDAPGMTGTGVLVGTPDYMAPEQINPKLGPIDAHTDIYALGVLAYRMLTGERPFTGSTTEVLMAHLTQSPPPASEQNPRLSPAIDAVLAHALAKKPAERTDSAGAFARQLRDAIGEATAVRERTPPPAALRSANGKVVIPSIAADHIAADAPTTPMSDSERQAAIMQARQRRRASNWPIVALVLVIVAAVLGGAFYGVLAYRRDNSIGATQQAQTDIVANAFVTQQVQAQFETQTALVVQPGITATVATSTPTDAVSTTATTQSAVTTVSATTAIAGSDGGVVVPSPVAQPTARPQPTGAPVPPAPTLAPAPTVAPAPPTATPCAGPLQGGFGLLWRNNPGIAAQLGCPGSAEAAAAGSVQYFEGGMMYWWQGNDTIYVLYGGASGTWQSFANPNDPSYDEPSEQAPAGFIEPIRGFGTIWHTVPGIREAVGWGTSPEYPITGIVQFFPNGLMFYAPALEGREARIWVLTNAGGWTRYRDPNS